VDWVRELTSQLDGAVSTEDAARQAAATDFGRIITRLPQAVVHPRSAGDVARVVRFAAQEGLSVATRGAGHSQSGQSLSSHIVLRMDSLSGVRDFDQGDCAVKCGGGTSWRTLLAETSPQGLSPPVLTNNLDVCVGGTLSTGGLGVASWRHGTQADHCLELEVVTGEGEIVHCSPEVNTDLFDAVRGGMGQFGVITEAKLRLRRHQPRVRTFLLLYDDLTYLLEDLRTLMAEERFDYLESWCVPCPQGFKKVSGERQPFAQWFYPLHLTLETGETPPAPGEKLAGLRFYRLVHTEDGTIDEFFSRLDALFGIWKRTGAWNFAHPWMECILPWGAAQLYIAQVLANLPPQAIAGGHILLWPARGGASGAPLFMRPPGEYVMGFGILPAVPPERLDEALARLAQASAASLLMGGKRYLSGWVAFDAAQWRAHYGPMWPRLVSLKSRFDPKGILNPGFIPFG
jgi:cytokinin dehydrogenase